jgi:hypothetical protein
MAEEMYNSFNQQFALKYRNAYRISSISRSLIIFPPTKSKPSKNGKRKNKKPGAKILYH